MPSLVVQLPKRSHSDDAASIAVRMWSCGSRAIAGSSGPRSNLMKSSQATHPDCSDEDTSPCASEEVGLECPICWEFFNIVENVPYVLWCGHTLCKNCILGLQWAVIKFPTLPIQLPLFISCPWCHHLSFRLVYRGQLKFPRKNFFLLWMVESMNSENARWCSAYIQDCHSVSNSSSRLSAESSDGSHQRNIPRTPQDMHSYHSHRTYHLNVGNHRSSLRKSLAFLAHLTAKLPLVVIFLLIVLYAIPASVAILVLYILVTVLFGLPSFLILYFAYPGLDWLVREITA